MVVAIHVYCTVVVRNNESHSLSVIDKICYVAHTQIYAADYLDLCDKNIMKTCMVYS